MAKKNSNETRIDIKTILLGDSGVGKTSLINVLTGVPFDLETVCTISTTYVSKEYNFNDNQYKVNLWDTAGEEKYRQLTKLFYKGSDIVIFVYDISSKSSFKGLNSWIKEVKDIVDNKYTCGLVGNKKDLFLKEEVKESDARALAKEKGYEFALTSAKNSTIFCEFLEKLIKIYLGEDVCEDEDDNNNKKKDKIKIGNNDKTKVKKKCC